MLAFDCEDIILTFGGFETDDRQRKRIRDTAEGPTSGVGWACLDIMTSDLSQSVSSTHRPLQYITRKGYHV